MSGLARPIPYQWNVGDVGSAALLDAQLYNGLTFAQNPPLAWIYQTSAQSIANNTWTSVLMDTNGIDTYGGHSTSSNTSRYVCQEPGTYQVSGSVTFATNSASYRAARLYKNGTTVILGSEEYAPGSSAAGGQSVVTQQVPIPLVAGDYIELQCWQNTGGLLALIANGEVNAALNIQFEHA